MNIFEKMTSTYRDTVVIGIPDDLIFDLLPALQALVDDDLCGVSERRFSQVLQLSRVLWIYSIH